MTRPAIAIRKAAASDLPLLQVLLGQLGYPLDPAETVRRFAAVTACAGHAVLVADRTGKVVAMCHVYTRPALDKPSEAVVQALVVQETARGEGVGRRLMEAAAAWARDRDLPSVTLSSHVARSDAHAFYAMLGYQLTATSHLFRKELEQDVSTCS